MQPFKKAFKDNQDKQKKVVIPAERSYKGFKYALWIGVALVFVVALIAIFRQGTMVAKNKALGDQVTELQTQVKSYRDKKAHTDNEDVFARYFIQDYYDIDKDKDDYDKSLKPYLADGVETPDVNGAKGHKDIQELLLWDKANAGKNKQHLTYLVNYSYQGEDKEVNAGDKKDKKKTKKVTPDPVDGQELIRFDVKKDNGAYTVISEPYTESVPDIKSNKAKKATNNLDGKAEASANVKEKANDWLDKTFLPRYVESDDPADVSYMMNNAELLGGSQKYDGIDEINVYKQKEQIIVKTTINVKDAQSEVKSKQDLTLNLKQQGSKFHVTKLSHTLGKE